MHQRGQPAEEPEGGRRGEGGKEGTEGFINVVGI